ncbi:MAG TPA: hypothetical protein VFV38_43745 [Ktedonobacteraceae bacterium]|nr:hypothetical protein [Ktedonobacteraceae bacterium]
MVEHADEYRQLFDLETRLVALANVSADSPEVEQLVEDYARSQELARFYQQLVRNGSGAEDQFSSVLLGLMNSMVTPAQQHFFELLTQRAIPQQSGLSSPQNIEQEQ